MLGADPVRWSCRKGLVPVLAAITTLGCMGVIAGFALPIYLNCVAGTGYLLVILVFGPHLERWRLIGKHRITFGWNAATQAAKDFVEI